MTGDAIALSLRLKKSDWLRLHALVTELRAADAPAPSLQGVIIAALNDYLTKRGEAPLETQPFGRGGARTSRKRAGA
ncbi:hypothetical protein VY88_12505 [Azospirillum thiophilum]|uniref:Uncharacterized protein n=1 Tax=Azospirillum thiophilum TaxID=528244 RepID=A0AAC9EWV5_9PROT|nr:hypothetical protein [Azospirillum thiophilum]ALG69609.1 hypothetical protein AL072_00205 [Azospirillum thiophilum]KJR66715.1 hypothetical protein VY88_12505 [Azospirillum thiophilum]